MAQSLLSGAKQKNMLGSSFSGFDPERTLRLDQFLRLALTRAKPLDFANRITQRAFSIGYIIHFEIVRPTKAGYFPIALA
jgi:hypothetical protein